jgi:hypothetical protein
MAPPRKTNIFANPYYQQFQNSNGGLNAMGAASVGADALKGGLQFATALQQANPNFNVNAPTQMSIGGRPQYNLGNIIGEASGYRKKDYGKGLIGQGLGAGLQVGLNPALLAATGGLSAPIGAAVGALGGLIGRDYKRNKAEQMQQQRVANIQRAQQQYNQQQQNYNQGYLARQQYEDQFS